MIASLAEKLCELEDSKEQIGEHMKGVSAVSVASKSSQGITKGEYDQLVRRRPLDSLFPLLIAVQPQKLRTVLDGLGLSKPLKRLDMSFAELSGGWRMRCALAQVLSDIDDIDVLLLDEATNHCMSTPLRAC